MNRQTCNSPTNTYTTNRNSTTYLRHSREVFLMLSMGLASACGPNIATEGGDGFGTGGAEQVEPTGPVFCVEMVPSVVTCHVDWDPGSHARVLLPCQITDRINGGIYSEPYDFTLDDWGLVTCYDFLGTGNKVCYYGEFNVELINYEGEWLPQTSTLIGTFPGVDAPCGNVVGDGDGDPGDGDGDPGDGDPGDGDGDPIDDGRLKMVEFQCVGSVCQGRWEGTDLWSIVNDADAVAASVAIPEPWACSPDLDVDICIEVDQQGHVGCFWYQDGWAVAVAPSCAVSGDPWLDVGNSMLATAI